MIDASDTPLDLILPYFTEAHVDVTFLVPTATGYHKSIMDATAPVRDFLKRNKLHNYEKQDQGPESKVMLPAYFVLEDKCQATEASLYRPKTKQGDPRIWFKDLKHYCSPENLLAIITNGTELYVINVSQPNLREALLTNGKPREILNSLGQLKDDIANELLGKLQRIHQLGYLTTVTDGSTGIGMTLEHYLGIPPNAAKTPDYKGIEIKTSRITTSNQIRNRVNLFSKTPDWKKSMLKSGRELLNRFGYIADTPKGVRKQLYCTLSTVANAQGLYLEINEQDNILHNLAKREQSIQKVVQWSVPLLEHELAAKHKETFWVKAQQKTILERECFLYDKVIHTRAPNVHLFSILINARIITLDYTLSSKDISAEVKKGVKDHGYIFKIQPKHIPILFPNPITYHLSVKT